MEQDAISPRLQYLFMLVPLMPDVPVALVPSNVMAHAMDSSISVFNPEGDVIVESKLVCARYTPVVVVQ